MGRDSSVLFNLGVGEKIIKKKREKETEGEDKLKDGGI